MKTLLHPPLLESWALNTLAVKPQETKHGPTCCLSESPVNSTVHDKLENLALWLTPSSTCKESSLNASQSSLVSQYWKARKWLTCLICEWLLHQGWSSSNRCLKQGPSLGESRQAVTGGEPRLTTPAQRKWLPSQHWWWNWTAVPRSPGLSEQAAFNVLGKLLSPVCLFLDQKASSPAATLYSTQQFFAKCCQSQRLNAKTGKIW